MVVEKKMTKYSFSRGFQESVVALMFREPTFIHTARDVLNPTYFTHDDLSCLARLVLQHVDTYHQTPAHLDQVILDYAAKLSSSSTDAEKVARPLLSLAYKLSSKDLIDADYVKDNIIKFGKFHSLMHGLESALQVALNDDTATGEEFESVVEIILQSLAVGKGSDEDSATFEDFYNLLEENEQLGASRVATGLDLLDQDLNGGIGPGEVGAIVAASGVGKSLTLNDFAINALLKGTPVLYVSCELYPTMIKNRLAAGLLGMDSRAMESPTPLMKQMYKAKLNELKEKMGPLPLQIQYYPSKTATVGTIRSLLSSLKSTKGFSPGLLIVDYADELRPTRSSGKTDSMGTYLDAGAVYKELRVLGKDHGFGTWSASQYNRTSAKSSRTDESAVADMDSLADSYMKVMVADFIVTLNQTRKEAQEAVARSYFAKNRRGPAGRIIDLSINYPSMRISQAQFQYSHESYYAAGS